MFRRGLLVWLAIIAVSVLILAACGGGSKQAEEASSDASSAQVAEMAGDTDLVTVHTDGDVAIAHQEGDDHATEEHADADHMDGALMDGGHVEGDGHSDADHTEGDHDEGHEHGVPEEAMAVPNPVPATEESIAAGRELYAQYCAVCHGEEGRGDGPGGATLDPKPADFHADHVQVLSDGGLFWFITNGAEGTAMPAWGAVLSEEQRWDLVNYLRTFGDK